VPAALERVGRLSDRHLPEGYRTPIVVRLSLAQAGEPATEAELESRIKLRIPREAIAAGRDSVSAVAATTVRAFERILCDPQAAEVLDGRG